MAEPIAGPSEAVLAEGGGVLDTSSAQTTNSSCNNVSQLDVPGAIEDAFGAIEALKAREPPREASKEHEAWEMEVEQTQTFVGNLQGLTSEDVAVMTAMSSQTASAATGAVAASVASDRTKSPSQSAREIPNDSHGRPTHALGTELAKRTDSATRPLARALLGVSGQRDNLARLGEVAIGNVKIGTPSWAEYEEIVGKNFAALQGPSVFGMVHETTESIFGPVLTCMIGQIEKVQCLNVV